MEYNFSFADGVARCVNTVRVCSVAWSVSRPDGHIHFGVSKDEKAAQSNIAESRRLWSVPKHDRSKCAEKSRIDNANFSAGCKVEIVNLTPGSHS